VNQEIRAWRRLEERHGPWSGAWVAVHTARLARGSARERARRARALRLLGFRPFTPGLEIRPDNLTGGVAGVRQRLAALGLAGPALVFRLDELEAAAEADARALWDGAALAASYRATRQSLERSAARLADLPRDAAMAESFRVGGTALRQLVLDPLLPEPIVAPDERRALLEVMRRYDALGRRAWAGWLGDERDEPADLPAGVNHGGAGATALWPTTPGEEAR
jgi:phenylacetic acid degradation operon negative regulatory protein